MENNMEEKKVFEIDFSGYFNKSLTIILTCHQGEKEIHLILDTGASQCCLEKSRIDGLSQETLPEKQQMIDINGNSSAADMCKACFDYGGLTAEHKFMIRDFHGAFAPLEQRFGIEIHGLIGTNFLVAHKAQLDYGTKILRLFEENEKD